MCVNVCVYVCMCVCMRVRDELKRLSTGLSEEGGGVCVCVCVREGEIRRPSICKDLCVKGVGE